MTEVHKKKISSKARERLVLREKNGFIINKGEKLYHVRRTKINYAFIEIVDNNLVIEGAHNGYKHKKIQYGFIVNGKFHKLKYVSKVENERDSIDKPLKQKNYFETAIPLTSLPIHIKPAVVTDNKIYIPKLIIRRFTRINTNLRFGYKVQGEYIIKKIRKLLVVQKYTHYARIKAEIKYLLTLISNKKTNMVIFRTMSRLYRLRYNKKKIWIISDRYDVARDNGEAFFKYLASIQTGSVKPIFAIDSNSEDYQRLKKYGRVIDRSSFQYKCLFMCCDKLISTQVTDFVMNPFSDNEEFLRDMFKYDFVFLQHGITQNNLTGWLNRYRKNIKLFIASAFMEYSALINDGYGYSEREVKLTGMPRFDLLINTPKQKIVIAPSWREGVATDYDHLTGKRKYDPNFKKTEYFSFYNELINDNKLLTILEKYGMIAEFYLHPSFISQIEDFKDNIKVKVMRPPYDYQKIFEEGSVLVTDYSSVAFDFAYLKKPIIYAQFDQKFFWKTHKFLKPGHFSYENDGFGPVTTTYDETVKEIISIIINGCKLDTKYKKRIESFFYKFDKNNSKRVYEAILDIDKRKHGAKDLHGTKN